MARDPTYLKVSELAKVYHRAKETVYKDLEMIDREPRYNGFRIYLHDDRPKMVNINVYEDFLYYKTWLQDKHLRQHLEPFDPIETARQRGEGAVVETQISEEKIREVVMKILRGIVA